MQQQLVPHLRVCIRVFNDSRLPTPTISLTSTRSSSIATTTTATTLASATSPLTTAISTLFMQLPSRQYGEWAMPECSTAGELCPEWRELSEVYNQHIDWYVV